MIAPSLSHSLGVSARESQRAVALEGQHDAAAGQEARWQRGRGAAGRDAVARQHSQQPQLDLRQRQVAGCNKTTT